jgi:hypothetical protein
MLHADRAAVESDAAAEEISSEFWQLHKNTDTAASANMVQTSINLFDFIILSFLVCDTKIINQLF